MQVEQVWSRVQSSLRERLGAQNYEIWIRPIQLAEISAETVHLEVPNRYYRDWVQANYGSTLSEELQGALGYPIQLRFQVSRRDDSPSRPIPATGQGIDPEPIPGVAPDKTFEHFVVGKCNEFAHAAALAVSDAPGECQYNPLFIYGSTGLGKTHLLHAIGNEIRRHTPDSRVIYCTAEQFTNELIDAIRYRRMPEFRDRYRKQPTLLLLDDVQFLSGKDRTQEELFHTFEWLKERGHQIVFTSDVLPREIKMFEPRLRTRCESGMLADTQPPDMETLLAILRQKAESLNIEVPEDLAQWVAARVRGNIRELEGVLNRLQALVRLHNAPLTIEFASTHLGSILADEPQTITAREIIQTVSSFYNIKVSDLKGQRRLKQLVRPRHVSMYLVRKHTDMSFPEIGRAFGNRDHATIQHACKKIRTLLQKDADLRNTIQMIARGLGR